MIIHLRESDMVSFCQKALGISQPPSGYDWMAVYRALTKDRRCPQPPPIVVRALKLAGLKPRAGRRITTVIQVGE